MVLGYYLQGQDNDSFLNEALEQKGICLCLDYIKHREKYISKSFEIKYVKYDFSYTYDGALIISRRFKDFCIEMGLEGLKFYHIESQPDFFLLKVGDIVEFDCKRRKTRFLEFDASCEEYNEVVGATPVCLKENKSLENGIYRTDIEFGRGFAKAPLILVGVEIYQLMKQEKFSGLFGEEILDKYNWEK